MGVSKLYFRYSLVYDRSLANLAKQPLPHDAEAEGRRFTKEFGTHWKKKNDTVFKFYKDIGFILPDFWLAYPVHPQPGLIPFNDPLTFFITTDFDEATATVIHELCHTFFGYFANSAQAEELWSSVVKAFPKEAKDVQEHILVNLLSASGYLHIFSYHTAVDLIQREMNLPSLAKSWRLLDESLKSDLRRLRTPLEVVKSFTQKE